MNQFMGFLHLRYHIKYTDVHCTHYTLLNYKDTKISTFFHVRNNLNHNQIVRGKDSREIGCRLWKLKLVGKIRLFRRIIQTKFLLPHFFNVQILIILSETKLLIILLGETVPPLITPNQPDVTADYNVTLTLKCQANEPIYWHFPVGFFILI